MGRRHGNAELLLLRLLLRLRRLVAAGGGCRGRPQPPDREAKDIFTCGNEPVYHPPSPLFFQMSISSELAVGFFSPSPACQLWQRAGGGHRAVSS